MTRFLPPLLLALALAVVAVRCLGEPYRAEAQARISGVVQGGDTEEADRLLTSYLDRYDGDEDVWFAARMWFRMHRAAEAIDAVWNNPRLAAQPGTPRRFAEAALFAMGWADEARDEPTAIEPHALVVLVEGGNPWAEERLGRHARTMELRDSTAYFFPAVRGADRRPIDVIIEGYRTRDDKRFHVASAFASLGPEPYPDRDADRDRLIGVLEDETWRRQYADVWAVSAFALGRLGDEASMAALQRVGATLEGSVNDRDQQDLLLTYVGLIAGGDFGKNEQVADHVLGAAPNVKVLIWWQEALIDRYGRGDARTELWLRRLWEGPAARFNDLRTRQARGFLLTEKAPDDEARRVWVERMLADLEAPGAPLVWRVMAQASRLRHGDPAARGALIDLLREAAAPSPAGKSLPPEVTPPVIEALRALYLYG